MRALLTENPSRTMADVIAVLRGEQLIPADGRANAERLFYKVRRSVWIEKKLLPSDDGGPKPPAARTATATPPRPPQQKAGKPAGRFENAVGIAVAGATQTGDADFDPFESLVLTKQVLAELPSILAENPVSAAVRLSDLTDQVGGTVNLRRCLSVAARLDAITRPTPETRQLQEPVPV
jgi:hypothetical protein